MNDPLSKKVLSTKFLESLFEAARNKGMSRETLLVKAGLDPLLEDDIPEHISGSEYLTLLDLATSTIPDPDFGLHVGEAIKPGHYGILGYACMSSASAKDLIDRVDRYQRLVTDICSVSTEITEHSIIQRFDFDSEPYPHRQLAEENLAGSFTFVKWISGTNIPPVSVNFQHPKPSCTEEHKRIFNCPIQFNQHTTSIHYPLEYLMDNLPQADPVLARRMDSLADEKILKIPSNDGLIESSRVKLADLLQSGVPTIERLAESMALNVRTLQRQLSAEDISYKTLLDETRCKLASIYMKQHDLSLTDIAFLLGFSEQSSFQRAFKRWTGQTPGSYRKSINSGVR